MKHGLPKIANQVVMGFESHWGSKTSLYFSPKREVWNDSQTFSNTSFQFNLNTFGHGYFYLDKKSLGKSCCSWHGFGYLSSLEASGQWQIQDPTGCCLTSCWPSQIECLQGVLNVFIGLDYDCFELDGFDQQFKPLSTALISAVDKSQQHQEWKILMNAENWARGSWARCAYATSELCLKSLASN